MLGLLLASSASAQIRQKPKDAKKVKAELETKYQVPDEFVVLKSKVTLTGPGPRKSVPNVVWVGDALIEFSAKVKLKGSWNKKPPEKKSQGTISLVIDIEKICPVSRLYYRAKKSGLQVEKLDSENIHEMVRDLTKGKSKKFDSFMIHKKIGLPRNFPMDWVAVDFGEVDFPSSGREKNQATLYRFVVRENNKLKNFSQQPAYFVTSKSPYYVKNAKLAISIMAGLSSTGFINKQTKDFLIKAIKDWRKRRFHSPRRK